MITPRVAGIAGFVVAAVLEYGAITVIAQGRGVIGAQWRSAVLIGGGASVGLLALMALALALAVAWRRPRASRALHPVVLGLVCALALIAWAGLQVVGDGGAVTSPWQVALAASFVPVGTVALVVTPLLTWRRRSPGGTGSARRVIVATIIRRGDGWSVSWTGMGRMPRALRAPTMTDSVTAAEGALLALEPQGRDTYELRMVIYPGPYRAGPSFEVTGGRASLTATSARDPGQTVTGRTVEDLVAAIEQTLLGDPGGFRLRWTRPGQPD